jgi:hypothetical protein
MVIPFGNVPNAIEVRNFFHHSFGAFDDAAAINGCNGVSVNLLARMGEYLCCWAHNGRVEKRDHYTIGEWRITIIRSHRRSGHLLCAFHGTQSSNSMYPRPSNACVMYS